MGAALAEVRRVLSPVGPGQNGQVADPRCRTYCDMSPILMSCVTSSNLIALLADCGMIGPETVDTAMLQNQDRLGNPLAPNDPRLPQPLQNCFVALVVARLQDQNPQIASSNRPVILLEVILAPNLGPNRGPGRDRGPVGGN
jgi:hypothetical protein